MNTRSKIKKWSWNIIIHYSGNKDDNHVSNWLVILKINKSITYLKILTTRFFTSPTDTTFLSLTKAYAFQDSNGIFKVNKNIPIKR